MTGMRYAWDLAAFCDERESRCVRRKTDGSVACPVLVLNVTHRT